MKVVTVLDSIDSVEDLEVFLHTLETLITFVTQDTGAKTAYFGIEHIASIFRQFVQRAKTAEGDFRLPKDRMECPPAYSLAPPMYAV